MVVDHDLLMFTAVDEAGHPRTDLPTPVLTGRCARSLVGTHRPAMGALLHPDDVLCALDPYVPRTRETRHEYSAILKLALIAEAHELVLRCGATLAAAAWAPADEPSYRTDEVQTALSFIANQLDCSVQQAAQRLFALDRTISTSLIDTSRDIIAGRLAFVGRHHTVTAGLRASRGR